MDTTKTSAAERYEALITALDQYTENQTDHEETEWTGPEAEFKPSPNLRVAREMLDELNEAMLRTLRADGSDV